ncbi:MAG: phosphoglycerate kinase [Candidatus Magasanikbacteria bacterium CG10_big_fil_rev_8_21_14_0_10_40_10]|uniref:Phosphoglycerate kinase n=1 Tax=Candidatus Magasanikbacteria bacterium CG10_big_fil_rev_8_21_14_0_10_40_10 TaxID=1974648 RepID=A0A2M6W537_9BACT|nr:MAG: phosphoglycerate kinase [Candidatus Magasanikbacteria bacterium CG10_big_fil_rev_8_21_14_0_10_40_10]
MLIKNIKQIKNLKDKRVLVRLDFNVPIKAGQVTDDFRIRKSLPTIEYLLKKGAKIILMSHLGRPKGKIMPEFRLTAPAKRLAELLNKEIKKISVSSGPTVVKEITKMKSSSILFLENIQFESGETVNDDKLAQELASYCDYFVNDCFAQSHRAYASFCQITKYAPSYAGLLMSEEISGLTKVLFEPKKPLVVILGGAKIETKIPILRNLLLSADHILIGGGIVNTYLWAKGHQVGASLIDKEFKKQALLYGAKNKVIKPIDVVVGRADGSKTRVVKIDKKNKLKLTGQEAIFDIGPDSIKLFSQYIKKANTLIWNGAMGYFEQHPYEYGTYAVARLIASRAKGKAFGVSGGGETVEVLRKLKLLNEVDLVSTGGGAMLEFLSGQKLPGVEALKK